MCSRSCRLLVNGISVSALLKHSQYVYVPARFSNTVVNEVVEKHRHSQLNSARVIKPSAEKPLSGSRDYRFIYPEFLPNPERVKRDKLCERLERRDMLSRRLVIHIPEFYVGSIMAVTSADNFASGKQNRFVGICIQRTGHGLRANFTLRNVIDGQGVEIKYDMYNPTLHKIEVLKLEKRLDEELFYLRDAPAEYSTVPFDFEAVSLPAHMPVPVNSIKVKLGPRPWTDRWERKKLKGVEDLNLPKKFYDRMEHPQIAKKWLKYDLMKEYRETINDDEAGEIMAEVHRDLSRTELKHKT